jgi:hypothetical protein
MRLLQMPNYIKSNKDVRQAWFRYKAQYIGGETPSVVSFVAGWNACNSNKELHPVDEDDFFGSFV